MQNSVKVVNDILVNVFNTILTIEKATLERGALKELTITELHVIEAIGFTQKTMTEVASCLGIKVSTLTTSINKLVKKGYVERQYSDTDRRIVYVVLPQKGILAYRIHESFHAKMVKVMIKELSPRDNIVLIESLERLADFFKKEYKVEK